MAVLLLAQRIALRGKVTDRWLPLQSSFSEDQGGDCLTTADAYAWDLNVFTPSQNGTPTATYKLQIKQSKDDRSPEPGGPTVYIHPDLALDEHESWLAWRIIGACQTERNEGPRAAQAAEQLDARTVKLLNLLS